MKNNYYLCSVQISKRCIAYAKKLTTFAPTYANNLCAYPLWGRYSKEPHRTALGTIAPLR